MLRWIWVAAVAVCVGLLAVWWRWFYVVAADESEEEPDVEAADTPREADYTPGRKQTLKVGDDGRGLWSF